MHHAAEKRLQRLSIFDSASRLRATPGFGWIFSLTSFAAALVLRLAIGDGLPQGFPFLTFFPAVMLTAFLGGTAPAILCAALSTLGAWYFFIGVPHDLTLDLPGMAAIAFFVVVISIDIFIIHTMNEALEATRRERSEAIRLADERRTLFQELQHRVANNLAFVSSLLSIQKRRHADDARISAVFEDVRLRLETMSSVHRRLYDPSAMTQPIEQTLRTLCEDMVRASGRSGVTCRVSADAVTLPVEKLMSLSLVLIESVGNSLKHAFDGRDAGLIDVSLREVAPGALSLVIRDDGPGYPAGFDPARSDRLGYRIMGSFARSLRGEVTHDSDGGAVTRLDFPAA